MPINAIPSAQATGSRLIGLDVLRCLAVSVVLIDHSNNFGNAGTIYFTTPGILGTVLRTISQMGWISVHVFFVLSGFLVSGLLFREAAKTGSVRVSRFLIRRGFKIYPAFWVMTAATIAWMWFRDEHFPLKAFLGEMFYLQDYGLYISFHTWSLGAEEHFYFLLAAIFYVALRFKKSPAPPDFEWIPNFCLGIAVVCLVLRVITWAMVPGFTVDNYYLIRTSDFTTLDSLFFGVMLSHFWHNCWNESSKRRVVFWSVPLGGIGLVMLLPFQMYRMGMQYYQMFGFILLYLGSGCLLLSFMALDYIRCPLLVKRISSLGKYTYSVYLWHLLAGACVFPLVSVKSNSMFANTLDALLYFVIAWIVGIVLARLIELPVLRCRDRWFPSLSS
jgi:peptidoglycan/LPS O-acetylase OafA/YrhL